MGEGKHTPKADVRVVLTNPESGYESETTAKVTVAEWVVIDRILCGTGTVYTAALDLLEAVAEALSHCGKDGYLDCGKPATDKLRAAFARATAPMQEGE